ncbi:hypothetical protein [Novosphingobium beihaiensis]|uniref:Uncharacterized protein n=1 Tax=Novosphingobium beihaiensis TaxID=2930389 RepID=A0ABT0BVY4_9SPHN|nr:hypothetical protein [Novosphingobium beihaiensis]MCJ2189172.1 hypothetical protein [Novosphingobium beihaiensis]
MSRLVEPVPAAARLNVIGARAAADGGETGLERIAKYIPAEILAFYTMWVQGVATLPWPEYRLAMCILGAAFGVVLTYFYFDRFFPGVPIASRHYQRVISPIAFAVYSYTILGSVVPTVFVPGIALMLTAVVTVISAIAAPRS